MTSADAYADEEDEPQRHKKKGKKGKKEEWKSRPEREIEQKREKMSESVSVLGFKFRKFCRPNG